MLRKLTKEDCEITLSAELDEDNPIRGNAFASGDDAVDKQVEDELIERVVNGDIWAWARVTISASWSEFKGSDSIGGCSYVDENDFRNSDYFNDMVNCAIENLNDTIKSHYNSIKKLETH